MELVAAVLHYPSAQMGHLLHFNKNIDALSNKVYNLSIMRNDIKWKVGAAERRGHAIYKAVERWMKKVDKVLNDGTQLNDEASHVNSCMKGWCCGRYSLSKRSKKMLALVMDLLNEGINLGEVSFPAPAQDIDLMPMGDFEAFESTKLAMDLVFKALVDDKVSIIGVHGMGGVGKTTLMKKIGNQVKANKLFDIVVMIGISKNHDVKRVQDEIAEELWLSFGQEGGISRVKKLFTRLMQEMKVLIILDDMWKKLDLAEVGIPCGEPYKGCKVVVTTRSEEVCNMMKTQVNIHLECLSLSDSWNLFQKDAEIGFDSSNLNELARAVVNECQGLPAALVTLGRTMKDIKDPSVWENVLLQLQDSNFTCIGDMNSKVFKAIKLSYDYLPTEETRLMFLFCCLFPKDYEVSMDELLMFVMGEGLLINTTLNQAKRKMQAVLYKLTSSCLLLKGDRDGYFLMHGIIRDVAIGIASEYHGFIIRTGRGLERWPENTLLANTLRISLMENEISDLPERPECPKILTLTLSRCHSLKRIPESFFEGMTSLLALDLSHTSISTLPVSLARLENLRSLRLDGCTGLKDISLIGKLKKLEMISLKDTVIKNIPLKELGELLNLKLLALGS